MKNNIRKIIAAGFLAIAIGVPGSVYGYNSFNYSKYYSTAQEHIKQGNYDEAITNLNTALKYGKNKNEAIGKQITLVNQLKESKNIYENGLKEMENKNYLEAAVIFDKINKEDEQRYTLAQEKSAECKRLFIAEKLEKAKNEATNKNYLESIKYLDSALEIDNANLDALKAKSEYTTLYINTNLERAKKEAAAAKYSEALKTIDLVFKIDPDNSEALKLKQDYNKAVLALKEKKTTTTAVKKATTSVVKTNGAPPIKRPSETTQRQPVSFAQGSEAVRNEFKKMGFVFSSDTIAMYSEDGIEIGIVDRGDLWQVATKVWGPDVESIFFGCITIVRGRDTAFNTRFLLYNALDYGGVHSVGNIKAFVNGDMLVMHIGYPEN